MKLHTKKAFVTALVKALADKLAESGLDALTSKGHQLADTSELKSFKVMLARGVNAYNKSVDPKLLELLEVGGEDVPALDIRATKHGESVALEVSFLQTGEQLLAEIEAGLEGSILLTGTAEHEAYLEGQAQMELLDLNAEMHEELVSTLISNYITHEAGGNVYLSEMFELDIAEVLTDNTGRSIERAMQEAWEYMLKNDAGLGEGTLVSKFALTYLEADTLGIFKIYMKGSVEYNDFTTASGTKVRSLVASGEGGEGADGTATTA